MVEEKKEFFTGDYNRNTSESKIDEKRILDMKDDTGIDGKLANISDMINEIKKDDDSTLEKDRPIQIFAARN